MTPAPSSQASYFTDRCNILVEIARNTYPHQRGLVPKQTVVKDVAHTNEPTPERRMAQRAVAAESREGVLLAAVYHVLRYGKLGKQSRARLEAAAKASRIGRTHG